MTDTSPSILAQGASAEVVTLGNLSLQEIQGGQGNVFCEAPEDCWTDVDAGSYYPVLDPTVVASDAGDLGVDFCGRGTERATVGRGLEAACPGDPESFDFDFKRNFQCTYADLSGANESCHLNEEDTGGGEDTGGDVGGDSNEACTCSAQQPNSSRGWLLTVGLWILWRGRPGAGLEIHVALSGIGRAGALESRPSVEFGACNHVEGARPFPCCIPSSGLLEQRIERQQVLIARTGGESLDAQMHR